MKTFFGVILMIFGALFLLTAGLCVFLGITMLAKGGGTVANELPLPLLLTVSGIALGGGLAYAGYKLLR